MSLGVGGAPSVRRVSVHGCQRVALSADTSRSAMHRPRFLFAVVERAIDYSQYRPQRHIDSAVR